MPHERSPDGPNPARVPRVIQLNREQIMERLTAYDPSPYLVEKLYPDIAAWIDGKPPLAPEGILNHCITGAILAGLYDRFDALEIKIDDLAGAICDEVPVRVTPMNVVQESN